MTRQVDNYNHELVLNIIRFEPLRQPWSEKSQWSYLKQFQINIRNTRNCGDLIRASQKVLVIACKENGAISIYRKDAHKVNLKFPLVEVYGKFTTIPSVLGPNVGFVESVHEKNLSQTFVFLSRTYHHQYGNNYTEILSWEILLNDNENETYTLGLSDTSQDALIIQLKNM